MERRARLRAGLGARAQVRLLRSEHTLFPGIDSLTKCQIKSIRPPIPGLIKCTGISGLLKWGTRAVAVTPPLTPPVSVQGYLAYEKTPTP